MSETKKVRCIICKSDDKWQNVDHLTIKPLGMCICMKCGFVSYPDIISKCEDIKEFYRADYREAPTVQNVFTGQRKLHFHSEFLSDLFQEWKKDKYLTPSICEIGAAFGMFLKWTKDNFPKADITGTELTLTYRRNAYHEYGITLTEDFDSSKQYDLISSYKVAEHIANIDVELEKYAKCLKPNGLLYISVPTWFHTMSNFGLTGFNLDYYYHKNHINVWTQKIFETLLNLSGLEIVKQNHIYYDSTYLCKRNDAMKELAPRYEEPLEILEIMGKIKKASLLYDESRFDEAISVFPCFPDAHTASYEHRRAQWDKQGYELIKDQVLKKALEACPNSYAIQFFCADVAMRYSRWDDALAYLDQAVRKKPNDPSAFLALSHCYRSLAEHAVDPKDKVKFYTEARDCTRFLRHTSFQHQHDAVTWIFSDNAKIPMPGEGQTQGVATDLKAASSQ
jgi:2-polyprenyl-3-methyl-5-hydroxy-6-metoxy-1,4-benzoquinol methylase